ncbi:DUF6086 family protein [Kribbella sp. NPDC051936]|uniref:DUF6086 family protein n=1 Tax=Kribbella sp. NPDC051936 TaxID=3154946 RepID=UPI0034287F06
MSQYYQAGDTVLWNPSSGVSRVFLGQVRLFEDELSLASGIGPMEADECQVEIDQFSTFAQALLTYCSASNHQVLHALTDGFVITVLALAERAGAEVRPSRIDARRRDVQTGSAPALSVETGDELRQRAHAMLHSMPH